MAHWRATDAGGPDSSEAGQKRTWQRMMLGASSNNSRPDFLDAALQSAYEAPWMRPSQLRQQPLQSAHLSAAAVTDSTCGGRSSPQCPSSRGPTAVKIDDPWVLLLDELIAEQVAQNVRPLWTHLRLLLLKSLWNGRGDAAHSRAAQTAAVFITDLWPSYGSTMRMIGSAPCRTTMKCGCAGIPI